MEKNQFCRDCPASGFNEGWHDNEGQCKLNPPQYCGDDENENSFWGFPGIDRDNWCVRGRRMMAMNDAIPTPLNKLQQE